MVGMMVVVPKCRGIEDLWAASRRSTKSLRKLLFSQGFCKMAQAGELGEKLGLTAQKVNNFARKTAWRAPGGTVMVNNLGRIQPSFCYSRPNPVKRVHWILSKAPHASASVEIQAVTCHGRLNLTFVSVTHSQATVDAVAARMCSWLERAAGLQ